MTLPKFLQFPEGGVIVAHPFLRKGTAEVMATPTIPIEKGGEWPWSSSPS